MSEEPDDFDRLLGSLAKEGRLQPAPDPEEHPGSGTLFAYHEGKLSPEQRSQVEEHLSLCGRCRDLLVEYKEFAEDPVEEGVPGERGRVADFGAAADWHRLREKIRVEERTQRVDAAYEPGASRGLFKSLRTAYSIAAVLAVAVVGLSLYAVDLRRNVNQSEINLESYFLSTEDSARSPGRAKEIQIQANQTKEVIFELEARHARDQAEYSLMIFRESRLIYKRKGLQKVGTGVFRFELEPSTFPETGSYTIEVVGPGTEIPQSTKRYPFKVIKK